MSDEQLLVTLGIQDKGANKQITTLNKELKALDKEFKSASTTTKDFEKSQQGLATKLSNLNQKYDVNKAKLDAYKQKLEDTTKAIQDQQEKIANMKLEGKDTAKAEEQLQKMKNTLRDTERNISATQNEMERLNTEISETNTALQNHALDEYKKKMQELGDSIQSTGDRMKNFGQGMQTTGSTLMKLSAPMVAFSAYAVKVGTDYEKAMSQVQSTSGASATEIEKLSDKSKQLGEDIKGASATDVADSFNYLAMAGYNTNQMLEAIEPNVKASLAFGADMAQTADLTTDSLSALGLSAEDTSRYLDVVAQSSRRANTSGTQMLEAYIGAGGMFRELNTPLEESATLIGTLANRGIKGAEAGTSLNSVLINLMGVSGQAKVAMEDLGVSAYDQDGKFRGVTVTLKDLKEKLSSCTEEQRQQFEAMIGGKTQIDTLSALLAGLDEEYDGLHTSISNSNGALEEMYTNMTNNTAGNVEAFKSKLESLGIQLSDKLLPHINDLLDKLMDLIDWFGNLDEGTQETIIQMGLLTFATGGLLTSTGKLVSGAGSLVSFFGRLTTSAGASATSVGALGTAFLPIAATVGVVAGAVALYNEEQKALNSSVITSKEELGFLQSTLLDLNGVQAKNKEELEDLGLVYKDFSDGLSDDFKSAISEAGKDVENFTVTLQEMNLDGVLSEEETQQFNTRVDGAVSSALDVISSKKAEGQNLMSEVFKFNDDVIDENEQAIIDMCNKQYEVEAEEVKKNQDAINQIYNNARTENRTLTQDEISSIKQYYANIKQIELECKAQNNSELEASTIDFNNRIKGLDAQSASELLQAKKSELDEQLIQKKNQYDQVILMAEKAAKDLTGAEKTEADERIQNLKDEKEKCVEEYQGQWEKYQEIIETEAPKIADITNTYTGEILSNQDLVSQEMLTKMQEQYAGLENVTETGWTVIKDKVTGAVQACYVTVDENTGNITGCWNSTTSAVGGYTKQIKEDVEKMGRQHYDQGNVIKNAMKEVQGCYIDAQGQIVDSSGKIINSLKDVKSGADGVKTGIMDVNGTPVEIKTNAQGVIDSFGEVKDKMDSIETDKTVKINFIQSGLDWIKSKWDSITSKSVSVDANQKGTYSYSGSGLSTINEDEWELADNNSVEVLGTYGGNTLANIPHGTAIKTHMQSVQDMKYAVQEEVRKSKLNYANNNVSQGSSNIDYEKLANVMLNVVIQGLSNVNINNNINVDTNGIARNTIKMLGREDKINRVSKGRT